MGEAVERRAPGRAHHPPACAANGKPYRGINVVMLWLAATVKGYTAPIWMTYRQAPELGAQVRKGEQGSPSSTPTSSAKTETDETTRRGGRAGNLLHEGLHRVQRRADRRPARALLCDRRTRRSAPLARIDQRGSASSPRLGADIRHGGNRAFYAIEPDYVQMPPFETFRDAESYYADPRA